MKDVSQETLQAIQSNVKVEETQSLERSVDNLLQASWKDFEIAYLQPNLIPNGWNSFEPYGSGENYVENWDFSSDNLEWDSVNATSETLNNNLKVVATGGNETATRIERSFKLNDENMIIRMKVRGSSPVQFKRFVNTNSILETHLLNGEKEWTIIEQEFNVIDLESSVLIRIYINDGKENNWLEIDWIQVTPVDNQHLVVEKTPLGNGLTRIQTWGGNNRIKLYTNVPQDAKKGDKQTRSLYVKNAPNSRIQFNQDGEFFDGNPKSVWDYEEEGHKEYTGVFSRDRIGSAAYIRSWELNDNLDFIASDPQIVEGDKHNPVLVVDALDDGTEHVQVYGAYPDTKLVYKGGKGFIGENYKLTSNIKNEGVELGINTSIGSSTIPKGDSKLEIEGELQEQDFTIELGARDV